MTDTPPTEAPAPKPGSDLSVRFAMGVAMIAAAVLVTIAGGWFFRAFVWMLAAIMLVEWADMKRVPRLWAWVGAALAAGVLFAAAEYFYPAAYDFENADYDVGLTWLSFAPALGGAVLLGLAGRSLAMGWGFLYILLPAFCLTVLSWEDYGNGALIFWTFAVTWSTDIFAYFAGRAIGGPKLAPRISPNKTWAGLIGGVAGASFAGWAVAWYFELGTPFMWIGATMGVLAQLGDLYESWEKRRAGIKDSGSLLPGHGGVLDRLDGLLAVAVAVMLILMLDLWQPPEPPAVPDMMTAMHSAGPRAG
ncbi:MAG TPA: phosphatidate cytidylyltransferase [Allosphingosinicella sp.]|nr:phosphatidate cytidylyltransferase [Allosphingosinicella sp.]